METELIRHPGLVVLRLKGDMRLWGHTELGEDMLKQLRAALEDSAPHLVLNISGLTYIDTMGISSLVRILVECTKRHVEVNVVLPGGIAGEALRRIRVFQPWPSFPDEASALRAASAATS